MIVASHSQQQVPTKQEPDPLEYDPSGGKNSFRPLLAHPPKHYPQLTLLLSKAHAPPPALPPCSTISESGGTTAAPVASKPSHMSHASHGAGPGVTPRKITSRVSRVVSRMASVMQPRKTLGPLGVLPYWVPPEPLPFVGKRFTVAQHV
jgi:hypothetical protein